MALMMKAVRCIDWPENEWICNQGQKEDFKRPSQKTTVQNNLWYCRFYLYKEWSKIAIKALAANRKSGKLKKKQKKPTQNSNNILSHCYFVTKYNFIVELMYTMIIWSEHLCNIN